MFADETVKIVTVNTARFDATKHLAVPVVGDARECLAELTIKIPEYRAKQSWIEFCESQSAQYHATSTNRGTNRPSR